MATRIALIEDNRDNRALIRFLLEELEPPIDLDEYDDGASAQVGLLAQPPALVLMDISLPGMDGVEILSWLRGTSLGAVPVIALTAHAMEGDRERFLSQGFDDYVAKPILDEEELFAPIRRLLSERP